MRRERTEAMSLGDVVVEYFECNTCGSQELVNAAGPWLEVRILGPVMMGDEDRHYCSEKCLAAYYEPSVETPASGVVGLRP